MKYDLSSLVSMSFLYEEDGVQKENIVRTLLMNSLGCIITLNKETR